MQSRKRYLTGNRDRISHLPENVIGHILSLLPTKDALRTSVLSKDWEYKWTSIYNVNIVDPLFSSKRLSNQSDFMDFVERVVLHSPNIRSFSLLCDEKYDVTHMPTWMSVVFLRRKMESFELVMNRCDGKEIVLPRSLLDCTSLRTLRLKLSCTLRVSVQCFFRNLTTLNLDGVRILNHNSRTDTLLFTFPVLETFKQEDCKWLNVKFVEIYAPKLQHFSSQNNHDHSIDYYMKIIGVRIELFETSGYSPGNFLLTGTEVLSATVVLTSNSSQSPELLGLQVRKLLRELSGSRNLTLLSSQQEMTISRQGLPLSRYDRLVRLTMLYYANAEAFLELLHAAPFLKVLTLLVQHAAGNFDYDATKSDSVPSCVASHLEKVKFEQFGGSKAQCNLAKFFLKNGAVLKEVDVRLDHDVPVDAMKSLLSSPVIASDCVKIGFRYTY